MTELVIDTNVLVHANNPEQKCFDHCIDLINTLVDGPYSVCVDPGFNVDESVNKSAIFSEYISNVPIQSPGAALLAEMAKSNRIVERSRKVSLSKKNKIVQKISNKRDRIFVYVALNTDSKIFASNDFRDFRINKRNYFYRNMKLRTLCSSYCVDHLHSGYDSKQKCRGKSKK